MSALTGLLLPASVVLLFIGTPWALVLSLLLAGSASRFAGRENPASALGLGMLTAFAISAAVFFSIIVGSTGISRSLMLGGSLFLRLLILGTVLNVLAGSLHAEGILQWTKKHHLERVGLAFGLAINSIPVLSAAMQDVWIAHRNRSSSLSRALFRAPALLEVLLAHTGRIARNAAAAASLRGHRALLLPRRLELPGTLPLLVLSGHPGAGKSRLIVKTAEGLVREGFSLSGILQPGIFEKGVKKGFAIRDLSTGEERPLAEKVSAKGSFGTTYRFFEDGLSLAKKALGRVRDGDVLIIDELGPVELRGKGHFPALRRALKRRRPLCMLVVIRRQLVPVFLSLLKATDARVYTMGDEDLSERLLEEIRHFRLAGDSSSAGTDAHLEG